jgi:hypothetical protein
MQHDNPTMNAYLQNLKRLTELEQTNYHWRTMVRQSVSEEARLQKELQSQIGKRFYRVAEIVKEQGVAKAQDWAMRSMYDDSVLEPLFTAYKKLSIKYAKMTFRRAIAIASSSKTLKQFTFLSKGVSFDAVWQEALVAYLRLHGVRFVGDINETTRKSILEILAKADEKSWNERQIIDALLNMRMHHARAARIARTETTRAMNAGILMGAAAVPWEMTKTWITAEDEVVRTNPFSHVSLHNKVLPLEEAFNNGEEIRFPGDPIASAENVINCRCILDVNPKLDRLGRPIPRIVGPIDSDILQRLANLI